MRAKAIVLCAFLLISCVAVGAATYRTIHFFTSWEDGQTPFAGVTFDRSGNLYGVTPWGQIVEGTIFQLSPSQGGGWTYKRLYEFDRYEYEGAGPIGGLVMDEAGNVYGTTSYDHTNDPTCGSVFKLSPSGSYWTLTYLHYFAEGCDPEATLSYIDGRIWGTTRGGGAQGKGTVFSMDSSGGSFQFNSFTGKNGREPLSAFNLWGYGSTYSGGGYGQGNIYELIPGKRLIRKHSFKVDGKAGYAPRGDLLAMYVGGVRTMYGTTSAGGVGGGGTVYRLTETEPNSGRWRIKVLHSFSSGSREGWAPMAGLTADATGNLYGTTYRGGDTDSDCGTVFKLSPGANSKWTYTVLYSFDFYNNWVDGCNPASSVVFDEAGNLYGTTVWGGEDDWGAVYQITP